jgi:hypothetical protein
VPGWTDCCCEIAERQSVVGVARTETNRRAKLPSIGRAGGSGDGFGRAWSVAAVWAQKEEARRFTNGASADRRDGFHVGLSELVRAI